MENQSKQKKDEKPSKKTSKSQIAAAAVLGFVVVLGSFYYLGIFKGFPFMPLSTTRDIRGTWKTPFPVTFYIATNEEGELKVFGTESRMVTWTITGTTSDANIVDVEIQFTSSNQQIDIGSGYAPDVSPVFLKGLISGPQLILETARQVHPDWTNKPIGPEQVQECDLGNFTYTMWNMQGTWHDDWIQLGFEQHVFTEPNALKLEKQ